MTRWPFHVNYQPSQLTRHLFSIYIFIIRSDFFIAQTHACNGLRVHTHTYTYKHILWLFVSLFRYRYHIHSGMHTYCNINWSFTIIKFQRFGAVSRMTSVVRAVPLEVPPRKKKQPEQVTGTRTRLRRAHKRI